MTHPVASIIMPMYNAENYVCQALDAILCEKETAIEVIVINDPSTYFPSSRF